MRSVFIRLVMIAFFFVNAGISADDLKIANAYFVKAKALYVRGDFISSKKLLEEAVDFFPDFSEALYLLGKINCDRQSTTWIGIPLLEKALSVNNWTETPSFTAEEELIRVYVRTGRYRDALARSETLRKSRSGSPATETLRAEAFFGLGDGKTGNAVFERALELYPEEKNIYQRYITRLITSGNRGRARVLAERARTEFPSDPVFIYDQFFFTGGRPEKKKLLEAYRVLGGDNPRLILLFPDADDADFATLLNMFAAGGGAADIELLENVTRLFRPNKSRFQAVIARIGALAGEKTVDANNDGFYEEKYYFENGRVSRIIFDRNQDGIPEIEIEFIGLKPIKIVKRTLPEKETVYTYNGYPRLHAVEFQETGNSRLYELVPDTLRFAPLTRLPVAEDFNIRVALKNGIRFPGEKEIVRIAYTLIEDSGDRKQPRRKWELHNGIKLVLREDSDRDSNYEHMVIYNELGTALRGLVDFDGDGLYEIRETYVNGVLEKIEYDENANGKPEFRETIRGEKKEWDLNNDGIADVIETKTPEGKTVWEYTGVFRRK